MIPTYHAQIIARIWAEIQCISPLLGKCGSGEVFVAELAGYVIDRWQRNPHQKPPWQSGRRKSVGGRDQDKWRKSIRY